MTQPANAAPMNWGSYDVPDLWAMLEPEQERANYEQVNAWRRMSDVLTAHREDLQRIQSEVMERWPPEGGSAASEFLGHLTTLIETAQEGSIDAHGNASGVAADFLAEDPPAPEFADQARYSTNIRRTRNGSCLPASDP